MNEAGFERNAALKESAHSSYSGGLVPPTRGARGSLVETIKPNAKTLTASQVRIFRPYYHFCLGSVRSCDVLASPELHSAVQMYEFHDYILRQ